MMIDRLFKNRLIFVTGKGGVGKSTMTAALGQALAQEGRRTLILEVDTFSAMEDLLGLKAISLEPTEVGPNLWASNLRSEECFMATLRRLVPSDRVVRAIANNRVARAFFKAAPSVNEVTILDQVRVFLEDTDGDRPRYDHVLVDLPASGHAVTFLNVPATMHGMMRGIGPIAKMAGEVAEIVRDPSRSAIVAVCLPEEMPVNETIELSENLKVALQRGLTLALVNMVHQPLLTGDERQVFERLHEDVIDASDTAANDNLRLVGSQGTAIARLIEGNALALGWHDRDRHYLKLLHSRLDEPVLEIPVFFEVGGSEVIDRITDFLRSDGELGNDSLAS